MMANPNEARTRVTVPGLPHVLDMGLVRDVPGHARRQLEFWVFGMILKGAIGLQVGASRFQLQAGDYYVIPAAVHHFGLDQEAFDAAFFHFLLPGDKTSPARFVAELDLYGCLPSEIDYLVQYRFMERHYRRGLLTAEQLGVQLFAIMEQIAASQDHRRLAVTAASHHLAGAILDLLQNHYAEDLTAREISQRLGYSYTHLERVFRKEFKVSIHQQLLKVRIDAAAHGLQMGKSIKEVAGECGFADYYYFLKAFKRLRQMTPGTFQKTFDMTVQESGIRAAERLKAQTRENRVLGTVKKKLSVARSAAAGCGNSRVGSSGGEGNVVAAIHLPLDHLGLGVHVLGPAVVKGHGDGGDDGPLVQVQPKGKVCRLGRSAARAVWAHWPSLAWLAGSGFEQGREGAGRGRRGWASPGRRWCDAPKPSVQQARSRVPDFTSAVVAN